MNKDSLGDRMKENYEARYKFKMLRRTPVIIRIDGKAFHSFTKGFNKPFDRVLSNAMDMTMLRLCENVQGCVFGYTQSDEITLVLNDYQKLNSSAWFDNEVQKVCSIAASMATAYFNVNFKSEVSKFYEVLCNCAGTDGESLKKTYYIDDFAKAEQLYAKYSKCLEKPAMFDARCFNVPVEEVTNCVLWRQQDATRNSVEMVGRSFFSHSELHKKNNSDIQDMLMERYNVNWNNYPVRYKRGCSCYKATYEENGATRSRWGIDYNMPILTQDREHIEKWIKMPE